MMSTIPVHPRDRCNVIYRTAEAADPLRKALQDPAPAVRVHAALALAHIGAAGSAAAREATPGIVGLLEDPEREVRAVRVTGWNRLVSVWKSNPVPVFTELHLARD